MTTHTMAILAWAAQTAWKDDWGELRVIDKRVLDATAQAGDKTLIL